MQRIRFSRLFNKFNNTGDRMLDSIYHMVLKLLINAFWREHVKLCPSLRNVIMDVITFPENM